MVAGPPGLEEPAPTLGQHHDPAHHTHEAIGERVVEYGMARAVAPPGLDRVVVGTRPVIEPHEQLAK